MAATKKSIQVQKHSFSYKEIVTALLKARGIHKGLWGLYVEFGLAAVNTGPSAEEMLPTAIIPLRNIGLQEMNEITNISVDAAVANPKTKTKP